MISIVVPLLFAIVGVLLYALASNPKLQEMGRLMFAASWLVVMWAAAQHVIHL